MVTALIVDDSRSQREFYCSLLKKFGLRVVSACDGMEAIAELEKSLPDFIVLDVVMPNMNGYDLCRHIRKDPRTAKIPVVMCSSKDTLVDEHWAKRCGADAYLIKPVEPKALIHTIRSVVSSKRSEPCPA
ncbi:MAG: response regulator [Cyanobacteria bacterium P01_H01_bin.15]